MKTLKFLSLFSLIYVLSSSNSLQANNGSIAYIYPISNITIDGNLDDWPTNCTINPMKQIHYGGGLKSPQDALASWRGGYDAQAGFLYIGVTMIDDDYVKTPDNSHFSSHDFQVLYFDGIHSSVGAGVIGYEIDEDHRKIVEQGKLSFYPQVKNASFDQVELSIARVENVVTYEWKVKVDGPMYNGRVIGFDYGVFDKDTDEDHVMITWGKTGGNKFMNANLIGDLVLLESENEIGSVTGRLKWNDEKGDEWPNSVRFIDLNNKDVFYDTDTDSLGHYRFKLPAGNYKVSVPPTWSMDNWNDISLIQSTDKAFKISIAENDKTTIEPIHISIMPKPDLIPQKGVLHSPFNTASADQVDQFVQSYQEYYNIPAVSLALIQDGKMVYHKSYGVENTVSRKPLRDEAVFEAASITKLAFAYVMNRLVQRGEFDLNKPLYESVPFPELEEYPEYKLMTGKHVLPHVSGLPNWGSRIVNKPGTKNGYSGEGFEYLKRVLAGGPSEELPTIIQAILEKELLNPLGMTNTYFMCNEKLPDLKVAGHFDGIPNMFDCPDFHGMAWSMHTEAKDFVPFALALLNRKGLEETQAKEMFRFHTIEDEDNWRNGYKSGYGLGVALRESPFGLVFGHGGNNGDFRCIFDMYQDLKTGYIMFTNANTGGPLLSDLTDFLVEGKK
ncbi:MAG: serine hydrolase [Bacteroidota bacterium]